MKKRKTRSDKGKKRGPYKPRGRSAVRGPRTYAVRTNGIMLVEAAVRQAVLKGGRVVVTYGTLAGGYAEHSFSFASPKIPGHDRE